MIAEQSSDVQVQSNIQGQSYAAGIDDENMPWVISLFTDLYSDPKKAVIREYSTNAHDAQVENGVDAPIEVTLPTPLAPFFKVKDYGCGLDADDIRTVYSRYGTSTKRGTNDQNGMLGMGCKSALAYTQQFTVESVKDGMRTVCSISREDGGVPVFTVVATVPADGEPNGTEVIVPVNRHDHEAFASKAADFYGHWKPGTVLVNDEQPQPIEGLKLTDDLMVVKNDSYNRQATLVVMGNVAYPVDDHELVTGLPSNYSLVAHVPIGAVTFPPSREALMYTKDTKTTLAAIQPKLQAAVQVAVQKEVEKAATAREAIQALIVWRDLLGRNVTTSGFSFKGKQLPDKIDGNYVLVGANSRTLSAHETAPQGFLMEYAASALFVTGYLPAQFTANHKRKLVQYAEDNGHDVRFFALTAAEKIDSEWVELSQITTWEDVKAVKLTSTSPTMGWRSGRPTGSYDAYIGGQFQHIQAEDIDQNEPVYYCRSMNRWDSSGYAEIIGKGFPAATIVCLPENRVGKFTRNFPEAKSYTEGLQAAYDMWKGGLTKGVLTALTIHDKGDPDTLRALDAKRIDDPALRRDIHIAKSVDLNDTLKARRHFSNVMHAIAETAADYDDPTDAYALLECLSPHDLRHQADHVYLYLNAVYSASLAASKQKAAA